MADIVTCDVERPVAGGRMLARIDGRVVLVSGAIPGERVQVRVDRTSRGVAFATVVDVLRPSPDRRVPACDAACGGLDYAHISQARQREFKAAIVIDTFRRVGKLTVDWPVTVAPSPEDGYRLRGRLHVRGGRAGFFLEGTNRLCDAAATRQFAPDVVPAVAALLESITAVVDDIDSIVVAENVTGDTRVVHLEPREGRRLSEDHVAGALTPEIDGVTVRMGTRTIVAAGRATVTDTADALCGREDHGMPGAQWTRRAASFFQSNRHVVGTLLSRIVDEARGARVLDLYAGVGLFSVGLAAAGRTVVAVEGDPTSAADLEDNAAVFGPALSVRPTSVESALATLAPGCADAIVLDPPRTGVSPVALAAVVRLDAPRIVYVSCDPATLARDAAALVKAGYQLRGLDAFDMFPNTSHIEALAVFER